MSDYETCWGDKAFSSNPFQGSDGWYWFDETYTCFGPFPSEKEAEDSLKSYLKDDLC